MSDESELDFAARRLDAFAAQVSQAGRVIAAARALVRPSPAAAYEPGAAFDEIERALDDYDHAAARAAALNEGSTG